VLKKFAMLNRGLVVVTGPTGSGKSTTLAAMVDYANKNRKDHIITLEDPIEFVHESKNCLVNHREVGVHTKSFASALRGALREDPDIILVGEMRDLETIELAITAAATGHLVFGTLHTQSAAKTVDRIIDVFPADQQNKIRQTLSESLKGIVAQTLFKRTDKKGRVAAFEILVFNTAVANLVREGKTHQIPGMIQVGKKYRQPAAGRPHHGTFADEAHRAGGRLRQGAGQEKIPHPSSPIRRKTTTHLIMRRPELDNMITTMLASQPEVVGFVVHGGPPAAGGILRRTQARRSRSADQIAHAVPDRDHRAQSHRRQSAGRLKTCCATAHATRPTRSRTRPASASTSSRSAAIIPSSAAS
jgi:hypothetical protein